MLDKETIFDPTDRYLLLKRVQERVPYSKTTIYRLINAGEFPKPIRLGANRVAWSEKSIDSWLAGKVAASFNSQDGDSND